jgi:hypothetical protein
MQISGYQNTTTLFDALSSSSTSSSSSSTQTALSNALTGLLTSIQSGDTADAKKYLAEAKQLSPSDLDSGSALGKFYSSVTTALGNNDISGAQTAVTKLEKAYGTSDSASTSTSASESSYSLSSFGTGMQTLFSAIASGNTSDAQSSYDAISSMLTDDNTSSIDTSSTSFTNFSAEIGAALKSGNINSVQAVVQSYFDSLNS